MQKNEWMKFEYQKIRGSRKRNVFRDLKMIIKKVSCVNEDDESRAVNDFRSNKWYFIKTKWEKGPGIVWYQTAFFKSRKKSNHFQAHPFLSKSRLKNELSEIMFLLFGFTLVSN